jgi:hypothetical protein
MVFKTSIPTESIIDREVEQEEFKNMLKFQEEARLLVIQDRQSTGKTTLLRRLHYNCKWDEIPPKPASLVYLDNTTEMDSPFALVEKIRMGLSGLQFQTFDRLLRARVNRDASAFIGSSVAYRAIQHFEGSTFSGGSVQAVSQQYNVSGDLNVNPLAWTAEQEALARQECISAFFKEIKENADQNPLVVLLDSYDDRCNEDLQTWIRDNFVYPLCFDVQNRPQQLLLVLAGRKLPGFKDLLQRPNYSHLIRSRASLGSWTDDHARAFLQLHGYGDLIPEHVNIVLKVVSEGVPIGNALALADGLRSTYT